MKKYFVVGRREPCGHRHRTRRGAERCARGRLWNSRADLAAEARELGIGLRAYMRSIVVEQGDGIISEIDGIISEITG